jgi:hypothetical protein
MHNSTFEIPGVTAADAQSWQAEVEAAMAKQEARIAALDLGASATVEIHELTLQTIIRALQAAEGDAVDMFLYHQTAEQIELGEQRIAVIKAALRWADKTEEALPQVD